MKTKILQGFFWVAGSNISQSAFRIINLVVLARLLTAEDFGIFTASLFVIGIINIFSQIGVGPSLVQLPDINENHVNTAFSITLCIGFSVGIGVWFSASYIASFYGIPEVESVLKLIVVLFPIRSLSIVSENLLQRRMDFKSLSLIDFGAFVAGTVIISLTMAFLGYGYWALVGGKIFYELIKSAFLFWKQPHSFSLGYQRKEGKELFYFAGGFTLSRIFNYLALNGDYLIVGKFLGASVLGFYNRAYRLMNSVHTIFGKMINTVMYPTFAKVQDERDKSIKSIRVGIELISVFFIPLSLFCFAYASEIVNLVLGEGWEGVIAPFEILSIGMFFRLAYKLLGTFSRGVGLIYNNAFIQFIYALTVILGGWWGTKFGLNGVAWVVLFALGLIYTLFSVLMIRHLKLSLIKFAGWHIRGVFFGAIVLSIPYLYDLFFGVINDWYSLIIGIVLTSFIYVIAWFLNPKFFFGESVHKFLNDDIIKFIMKRKRSI